MEANRFGDQRRELPSLCNQSTEFGTVDAQDLSFRLERPETR